MERSPEAEPHDEGRAHENGRYCILIRLQLQHSVVHAAVHPKRKQPSLATGHTHGPFTQKQTKGNKDCKKIPLLMRKKRDGAMGVEKDTAVQHHYLCSRLGGPAPPFLGVLTYSVVLSHAHKRNGL